METLEPIKMAFPKRDNHYWVKKEGLAEKKELLKKFNELSDEEKIKYNEKIVNGIEVDLSKSKTNDVENFEINNMLGKEEPKITLSLSELDALLDKKLAEKSKNYIDAKAPAKEEHPILTHIKNELFDDLPEIRNFKSKERIYVLCDGSKPRSFGIPTRHKDSSPLQYINKETGETFALFYSATQTSFFKEKHKGDSKVEHVTMIDGMLKTYENDIKLQKFLAINPHNKANGGSIFEEYNPSKGAEIVIDDFELETKARNIALELSFLKTDAIARLLCDDYSEVWTPAEVKKSLFLQAVKSPKSFIQLANDNSLEVKGIAKTAVDRGLISYKNNRFLNAQGEVLCEVGLNENRWDVIAEFFTSTEGERTNGINGRITYEYLRNSIG